MSTPRKWYWKSEMQDGGWRLLNRKYKYLSLYRWPKENSNDHPWPHATFSWSCISQKLMSPLGDIYCSMTHFCLDQWTSDLPVAILHFTLPICFVTVGISSIERSDPEKGWGGRQAVGISFISRLGTDISLWVALLPRWTETGAKTGGTTLIKGVSITKGH